MKQSKNKNINKSNVAIAVVLLTVAAGAGILFMADTKEPSDKTIRALYLCDNQQVQDDDPSRIYCENPEQYRKDVKLGAAIEVPLLDPEDDPYNQEPSEIEE